MSNNPFAQTTKSQDSGVVRRRSTRIDFITTVLLSGKDATGTPFREYTQTAIVNLHGCKVRTSYKIIVGMLVTIECPKAGTAGKGVCVRVWDPTPGVAGHEIAVQLIKPQNLWGVTNPPADWEVVAKSMVQGRTGQSERPSVTSTGTLPVPVVAVAPPPVAAVAPVPMSRPTLPAMPVPTLPVAQPVVQSVVQPTVTPTRPVPAVGPTNDQRIAELERRATQLMESVLDIMRGQAEELTRSALEEFRQQIEALIQDSEVRMRDGLNQQYEESASSLISLRTDLIEQIATRGAQVLRSTEDGLRNRILGQSTVKPPESVPNK